MANERYIYLWFLFVESAVINIQTGDSSMELACISSFTTFMSHTIVNIYSCFIESAPVYLTQTGSML